MLARVGDSRREAGFGLRGQDRVTDRPCMFGHFGTRSPVSVETTELGTSFAGRPLLFWSLAKRRLLTATGN